MKVFLMSKLYKFNVDEVCDNIFTTGYGYLPSIKGLIDEYKIAEQAMNEIKDKTYSTNNKAHLKLMELMELETLFEKFYERAIQDLKVKINKDDRYYVARKVNPGQSSEKYRAHFDSHLLTIVLPVKIPLAEGEGNERGELKAVPNARKFPKAELKNIIQKAYWKKYASEEGFITLSQRMKVITEYFDDYRPLAFMGITTLHGNNYVSDKAQQRLTFLCHLYDPSPRYGIGMILRKLRGR